MWRIKQQGYAFRIDMSRATLPFPFTDLRLFLTDVGEPETVYHEIPGERGFCEFCGDDYDSVDATSPVDLEYIKMALREPVKADAIMAQMYSERLVLPTAEDNKGKCDISAEIEKLMLLAHMRPISQ